jgi:hypothetical protein
VPQLAVRFVWPSHESPVTNLTLSIVEKEGGTGLVAWTADERGLLQAPVEGLQVPATWHWSEAVHWIGLEPTHTPDWHVSVCVQALPSSQAAPSLFAGLEQSPVPESQTPTSWHELDAVQMVGLEPTHTPDWHVSV